jgi:polysaccharide biosynthesis protein PslH
MKQFTVITSVTPTVSSGAGLRTYAVVAALSRIGTTTVLFVRHPAREVDHTFSALAGVRFVEVRPSRGVGRALTYTRSRIEGVPDGLARGISQEMKQAAAAIPQCQAVVADGPVVAAAVLSLARRRRAAYLAHNLESGFRADGIFRPLARLERRLLREFEESWMVTEADCVAGRALAGDRVRLRVVPNAVDVSAMPNSDKSSSQRLIFVGDLTYAPNKEGLTFLLDEVMPRVWREVPGVSLVIAGRGESPAPVDDRVLSYGFVENLDDVYQSGGIAVVPLLSGGGSPLKFIEAMARGLPVVSTSRAASLIEHGRDGQHFLACESARVFADAIVSLLRSPERAVSLGRAARDLAGKWYSIDAVTAAVSRPLRGSLWLS